MVTVDCVDLLFPISLAGLVVGIFQWTGFLAYTALTVDGKTQLGSEKLRVRLVHARTQ
jgi:hypothetical protein